MSNPDTPNPAAASPARRPSGTNRLAARIGDFYSELERIQLGKAARQRQDQPGPRAGIGHTAGLGSHV